MKFFLLIMIIAHSAFALDNDVTHRPKSFSYKNAKAVFVDFEEAIYDITYDITAKKADVYAKMRLHVVEQGHPIFDLIANPTSVKIDGIEVQTTAVKTPSNETIVRVIEKVLPVGVYSLEINVPLTTLVEFTNSGVKNAFWVTDLEDRFYLERYIPVNLEYDRIKMIFNIAYNGLKSKQHIFANGIVTWENGAKARIEFPEFFTVNSLYFHTTPVGSVDLLEDRFKSVDGREIPISIYMAKGTSSASTLNTLKSDTQKIMTELEKDYGAFTHSSIIIYNASLAHMGLGGMEYAGATVTNRSALAHELFHSYFARGVSPANGNAGWIDEALASWRDNGYNRISSFNGTSSMASRPYYTRKTDTAAYSYGARFMAFLDGKFSEKGGLKPFMNKLLEKKLFVPIFTEDFIAEMEEFYGEKVSHLFKAHVYSKKIKQVEKSAQHPIHRKMGLKELQSIL